MPAASDVAASGVDRIHGGASRETYRFVLRYREGGRAVERRLILRRDPPGSLIETERAAEFAAYRAFYKSSVPVPEALWLESDPKWLDHPFFVMEELAGFEASPQAITAPPYLQHHERLARGSGRSSARSPADREARPRRGAARARAGGLLAPELDYWAG
jgi:aminoglycoside phosphotransferase (APT) family kinase protein